MYSIRRIREPAGDLYVHPGWLGMDIEYMHCVEGFKLLRIVSMNLYPMRMFALLKMSILAA